MKKSEKEPELFWETKPELSRPSYTKPTKSKSEPQLSYSKDKPRLSNNTSNYKLPKEEKLMKPERKSPKSKNQSTFLPKNGSKLIDDHVYSPITLNNTYKYISSHT